jgi:hypothetical protein
LRDPICQDFSLQTYEQKEMALHISRTEPKWRAQEGLKCLSFAKTPQRPNIIQVTSYTTSSYVIHFKCAPNFGEPVVETLADETRDFDSAVPPRRAE